MDQSVKDAMMECTRGSIEERMTFPEVVMKLAAAGVERYHADLCRAEKTYYLPNGESERMPSAALAADPVQPFSANGVEAAVRAIQTGRTKYREFCAQIAAAGCVGYMVSLAGRRAVYYGRTGETYVEMFPAAK